MKRYYIFSLMLLIGGNVFSQTEADVVRYSVTTNTGSARASAMGGAFGALGGDLSMVGVNPAGIGVFRKSEISITPYLNIANTESNTSSIRKSSFQLGTLGGVMALYNKNFDWRGCNFGINYTNLNNFNRKTSQFVYDSPTNYPTLWANTATLAVLQGTDIPAVSEMAYNVRLIEWIEDEGKYDANLIAGELVNQHKYIVEDGYQGEYDFSFGTNFKDRLYLGITVGIQSIRYKYRSYYTGTAPLNSYYEVDSYDYNQYLKTNGIGTNFKVGMIYRPIPELRIGAAIHTPTYFSITDDYEETMQARFFTADADGNSIYDSYLIPARYDYDMQTPWKAILSLATVLNQKAIISIDYEFNNYRSAEFNNGENGYDYNAPGDVNENIRTYLKNTNNIRIGAEYRMNSTFSIRGGYAYWDSPYRHTHSGKIQAFSGGFGINLGTFYCDAAYIYKHSKDTSYFYIYEDPYDSIYDFASEPINNKYHTHEAKITCGIRF